MQVKIGELGYKGILNGNWSNWVWERIPDNCGASGLYLRQALCKNLNQILKLVRNQINKKKTSQSPYGIIQITRLYYESTSLQLSRCLILKLITA